MVGDWSRLRHRFVLATASEAACGVAGCVGDASCLKAAIPKAGALAAAWPKGSASTRAKDEDTGPLAASGDAFEAVSTSAVASVLAGVCVVAGAKMALPPRESVRGMLPDNGEGAPLQNAGMRAAALPKGAGLNTPLGTLTLGEAAGSRLPVSPERCRIRHSIHTHATLHLDRQAWVRRVVHAEITRQR